MNIILWIQSADSRFASAAINILAHQYENFNILAAIYEDTNANITINGKTISSITKDELRDIDYDVILVIGQNASIVPILKEAGNLQIDPDKIVLDRTVCIPGFTLKRYQKLRKSKLSILSVNCWGGIISHAMGLPFLSPIVNMFYLEKQFITFLKNPINYMNKELRFYKMGFDKGFKDYPEYPIFLLGDVQLHMNHYGKVGPDIARQKWEERRLKINWYNLLVMMYTENPEILAEFDELPYAKKICFVPFETDLDSAYYIKPSIM